MTKQETIQVLQSIEDRAIDFPNMTECDWVAIAAAKRHLTEEPVSEELEKVSDKYSEDIESSYLNDMFDRGDIMKAVEFGAKWQKAKDESTTEDLSEYINKLSKQFPEVSFAKLSRIAVRVAKWKEQQMMAKAVDGVVHRFDGCGVASVHYNDPNGVPMAYFIPSEGLSAGDKVKIITIKKK